MSSQSLGLGWNISPQGFTLISENRTISDKNSLLRNALNSDLKEVGQPVLAKELNKSQISQLVLQIQKIRNVSAPKANEDSQAAPRMLKLTLTDGESYAQAIETSTIPAISREKTAPGSKLLLNNVKISNGFLILNQNNTKLLGGQVQHLFEKWELAKSVQHCSRPTVASDGPPAWVNFGSKILNSDGDFKPSDNQIKDQTKENTEFEALRQGAIANASTGAVKKVFGGGIKQPIQNNNRIDNRGKFDGNRGKNNKKEVRNGREKEIEERPQKPSDKVSLFDFLEDKLNITETTTSAKSNKDEILNFPHKPTYNDKKNYNNDKNYTNQKNNYNQKKEFNNYNDRKFKDVIKKEPTQYQENYNKYEMPPNNSGMHKNEPHKTQEPYNSNKFNPKSQFGRDNHKDTIRNQDHSNYNKRYGKYENNDPYFHTNKESNKSIRNEKERMKDNWHYRAPESMNSNVEHLSEAVSKMSMNSEFASRSLRQHLNLEVKKPPMNNSSNSEQQNAKKFIVGDMCLVKYWEDGKFYPAKITASTDTTYVVQFKGYGNIEEVLKNDCAPFRGQDRTEDKRQYKGSLEFRRNTRKFPSS